MIEILDSDEGKSFPGSKKSPAVRFAQWNSSPRPGLLSGSRHWGKRVCIYVI